MTTDHILLSPKAAKRTIIQCVLGSVGGMLALFFIPWGWVFSSLGRAALAIWSWLVPIVQSAFDFIATTSELLATPIYWITYQVANLVWMFPKVCFGVWITSLMCLICLQTKGVFASHQTWSPRALQYGDNAWLSWIVYTLICIASVWSGVHMRIVAQSSDYEQGVAQPILPDARRGLATANLFRQLYQTGQATRHTLPMACQDFAKQGVPQWSTTMTINGKAVDARHCRFGRNTITWTYNRH